MAANTYKKNTFKKKETPGKPAPKSKRKFNFALFNDKRWSLSFGIIFMMLSIFMFLAFLSYLFVGQADQSLVNASGMPLRTKAGETQNLLGYTVHLIDGFNYLAFLSGGFGYELAKLSDAFLGWGTFILIFGSLLIFVIVFFNVDQINWFTSEKETSQSTDEAPIENEFNSESIEEDSFDSQKNPTPTVGKCPILTKQPKPTKRTRL